MRKFVLAVATAALFLAGIVGVAGAATADHLQCFKIKDSQAKTSYTATLTPSDPAFVPAGCTLKVPAKLLCVDAVKTNVVPTPPGAAEGVQLQKYLCYKAKCPKLAATASLTDQFGARAVSTKTTSIICAPVEGPCVDADLDTFCADVDCNDGNALINPDATETCDSADNNCDGNTDEGFNIGQACSISNGFGSCSGTRTCDGLGGATCSGPTPAAETCDGNDNNCDGNADEGNPGGGQPCSTGGVGVCAPGTTACTDGAIVCNPNNVASPETCGDGLDNDCDGMVDEGC
ncbi:MAG TPA: putative metal-binding motif-containing protein [Candidatus Limnocylindrales bacterium]|jgi:hypothetical protein|nr:putative metal-binding motif-containing protein [Candidatus Limnocylindrales bacterium]